MDESTSNLTFYEILGILPNATLEVIKRAYKQKCMQYHPDIHPEASNTACHEMMCKINEAYSILRDIESRKSYDEILKSRGLYYPEETPESDEQYYPDETSTPDEQPNDSESHCVGYSKQYDYYNSIDFDKDTQKEFILWLEDYADSYLRHTIRYYQHKTITNFDDLIERLYSLFENNINIEIILSGENKPKKSKSL